MTNNSEGKKSIFDFIDLTKFRSITDLYPSPLHIKREEAEVIGELYWGEIGGKVFKRLGICFEKRYMVNSVKCFALIAPTGFSKSEMTEFFLKYYDLPYVPVTNATEAALFGSVTDQHSTKGKVDIKIPVFLQSSTVLFGDISSMLRNKRDAGEICARMNQLIDGHIRVEKLKYKGELTERSQAIADEKKITYDPIAGSMEYDFRGNIIICGTPDFWHTAPTDFKERFETQEYEDSDSELIFNHVLNKGFHNKSKLPAVPEDWKPKLKKYISYKTMRVLKNFMENAGYNRDARCNRMQIDKAELEEEDFYFGLSHYFETNKEMRQELLKIMLKDYLKEDILKILEISDRTFRRSISEQEEKEESYKQEKAEKREIFIENVKCEIYDYIVESNDNKIEVTEEMIKKHFSNRNEKVLNPAMEKLIKEDYIQNKDGVLVINQRN